MSDSLTHFIATCPKCFAQLKVKVAYLGKPIRCKQCEHTFTGTGANEPSEASSPATTVGDSSPGVQDTERITVVCENCKTSLSIRRWLIGQVIRCKACERQFVVEAILISFVGGSFGIVFGFVMSRLIAWLAGWSTIVTASSIALAFIVSISVGLLFGIYPAVKAARLDPVEAIRYE